MKIKEKVKLEGHDKVTFLYIEIEDVEKIIHEIVNSLVDLSWIKKFNDKWEREAYLQRAKPTITAISDKLKKSEVDNVSSDAGEYIVAEIGRKAIIQEMKYKDVPLAEIIKIQKTQNPGFDFHSENQEIFIIIFGESKYTSDNDACRRSLSQINEFIRDKKDWKDLNDIKDFVSENAKKQMVIGKKGFAAAFSVKGRETKKIIEYVKDNKDFKSLLQYEELILVAVNI